MPRFFKRVSKKIGRPPGTLVHVGKKKMEKVKISVIDYNNKRMQEKELKKIEDAFPFKKKSTVTWINIDGLHDTEVIERIGKCFGIHPLVQEDILNTGQRPKVEDHDDYVFIVLRMITHDEKKGQLLSEQVSLVLGKNFVISFQEREGDIFNSIRERIRSSRGKLRNQGADYLVYSLMDIIVDNYFSILEKIGEKIESMEENLVGNPKSEVLEKVHKMKRELIYLRKSVWPLREVLSNITRSETKLIKKSNFIYFRDVYDHTIHAIDAVETYRDIVSGMTDLYLSSVSNKMNEVMKVLTIIATIFIPLTFIAGVYGMNFRYMPELDWELGYPAVWVVMIIVAVIMFLYFNRKKWI